MCSQVIGGADTPVCHQDSGHYADKSVCATGRISVAGWLLIAFIRFYRRHISPYTMPSCKYTPTCSRYALDAVRRYGAIKGSWLAAWRVLRCNPFARGGYDPLL